MEVSETPKRNRNGDVVYKQKLVNDYNIHMGGVDNNDAIIKKYSGVRKCHKWTTKVAIHFIEEVVFNAFFYLQNRFCEFKLEVINDLVNYTEINEDQFRQSLPPKCGRHFPDIVPENLTKARPTKKCVVCLVYVLHHVFKNIICNVL